MTEQVQSRAGGSEYDEDDFLHLGAVLLDYLRVLQRSWLLLIFLLLAGVAVSCGILYLTYKAEYKATAFYSVERTMSVYTDAEVVVRKPRISGKSWPRSWESRRNRCRNTGSAPWRPQARTFLT